ncbi:hypothetical protein ACFLWZ_03320 [Chloroflexota bacterium]
MLSTYCSTQEKRIVRVGNKIVGHIEGDTFIKSVCGSKHKLRCPPAWAVDAEVFDNEMRPNASEFVIIDKETGIKYHTRVDTFDRLKGELDRGFGRQYFLTLNQWEVRNNGYLQLNLWGGDAW